jgi:hypothetical protein
MRAPGVKVVEDGRHFIAELFAVNGWVEIEQAAVDSEHAIRPPLPRAR